MTTYETIWYEDNSGVFQSTTNSTVIKIEDMLQRLQTFKGEQAFNANNGIDYVAVFNKQAFLSPQIDAIISEYQPYFQSITYTYTLNADDTITVSLVIVTFAGDIETRDIIV
jgi:hypothetical protein